ncbi:phage tail baseplate protein [Pontixanthobacter sp.]|uniref:GTA baseplate fiber-binding domain-containing protein n=1 Tax=Pontixanthobacter sp. TaxID=2792078 RepID=UPI003C7E3E17
MATLLLTTVGTALGGPLGGAIGAFAGRALDNEIFGTGSREGPRLDELTVSTSSYGTAIPRHFGLMRSAGSIIWATELSESSETSGGKGQPKTTTYSYSTSFAVAVSSRPIAGIGRIWANGTLLRGANGALTVDGMMRVYRGYGDQAPDALIASQEGSAAPAFRGLAYVVFESLQLAEFGNRIPALTFEVIADDTPFAIGDIVSSRLSQATSRITLPQLAGFSDNGGAVRQKLEVVDSLFPLVATAARSALNIDASPVFESVARALPEAVSGIDESDFGLLTGLGANRDTAVETSSYALRYYDTERDYLPGVQRTAGRAINSGDTFVQFPGALAPDNARALIEARRLRHIGRQTTIRWRMVELDPELQPGCVVTVPGRAGKWFIQSSEWRENGIELELISLLPSTSGSAAGDGGAIMRRQIAVTPRTALRAFELPWDGNGSPSQRTVFVAGSALDNGPPAAWSGAALFSETGGRLDPVGSAGPAQAIGGTLSAELPPSPCLLFEPDAALAVTVHSAEMTFVSDRLDGLSAGNNTVLVGPELLQFATAEQIGTRDWILRGLLRGRGGTEAMARTSHQPGVPITLIDRNLIAIGSGGFSPAMAERIAAIGKGDVEPATAIIENPGLGLRPLAPVHGQLTQHTGGGVSLCWVRRARGAWRWLDGVDSPLNEERELYCVSAGSPDAPAFSWETERPLLELPDESARLHSGRNVWVQQVGAHAKSAPLYLGALP